MKFNFTPADIILGNVDYGLEQFLKGLFEQSKLDVDLMHTEGEDDRKMVLNGHFKQLAEVCYAMAEGYTLDDLCRGQLREGSSLNYHDLFQVLRTIQDNNLDSIEMMKAIAARERINDINKGLSKKESRDLFKSKVVDGINQVLKEEGIPINYVN